MRVVYSVINFLVLAAVLFIVGRKTVFKMFRNRRDKIADDLEAAENGQRELEQSRSSAEELEAKSREELDRLERECCDSVSEKQKQTQLMLQSASEKVDNRLKREFEIYRRTLIKEIERRVVNDIVSRAGTELKIPDGYDRACAFEIAKLIKKSVGDAITTAGSPLRIKIESASPLDVELSAYITGAAAREFGVGTDRMKVSVKIVPEIIGGVKVTVNDTVYDGSVANMMRTVKQSVKLDAFITDNADSISEAISRSISGLDLKIDVYQVGKVISVSDGICHISGLSDAMYGEMIEFENGVYGMVLDLEADHIGCIIFGSFESVEAGDPVRRSGFVMKVPVGEGLLGRVVDALGKPIDGLGVIIPDEYRPVECQAPSIPDRKSVSVPLQTGIKAIDALVPIGRGQRELIIGDRQTGKTSIAVDTIINQKGKNVICIYVAIGQKETTVAQILDTFTRYGAMEYTTIVCADAFHSAPMQYIAPYAGSAMGEYFMYKGRDVLIVFDDLSKHAVAYREISLLLHRPSGREAYPGDVFYLHSRLLERSARLSPEAGGGSMTALPIIETQAGDISAYIPTNAISITDGQIFLESELFHEGQRPAVNVGLSVSRVGGAAQIGAMRQIAGRLRMDLAQYRELAAFSQFGSDLDQATKASIEKGKRMMALLNQPQFAPVPVELQVLAIYAVAEGFADDVKPENIKEFENELCSYFAMVYPNLLEKILTGGKMSQELMRQIDAAITEFKENAA